MQPDQKPAALGYRMPAEWEPHCGHLDRLAPQPRRLARKVLADPLGLHRDRPPPEPVERVHIVVASADDEKRVADQLDAVGVNPEAVRFFEAATDRSWLRDTGPTFVVKDAILRQTTTLPFGLVDWKFNGWAKYDNHDRDNRLPRKIARWLDSPRWVPRIDDVTAGPSRVVMEGGAIDVNGRGTLLATEECLLSETQARNPDTRSRWPRADLCRLPRRQPCCLARKGNRGRRHAWPR